eukprot:TRINITY_DN121988_c0_g1_i1.p1 TRINITY_DN121988_c0_g1~~TRINITY_DN121988_c0_g1_i1.p1  ORF type:complete len:306 (-),score=69.37 TRINITY_DN121988_c0_g1_i1:171-1088(-)
MSMLSDAAPVQNTRSRADDEWCEEHVAKRLKTGDEETQTPTTELEESGSDNEASSEPDSAASDSEERLSETLARDSEEAGSKVTEGLPLPQGLVQVMRRASRRKPVLLIFDWDDTLLPSTFIQQNGLKLTPESQPTPEQWEQLKANALSVMELLSVAKQLGKVILVTNAERGWIELSCHKFMPWLTPMIESVKTLSARSEYEPHGVSSPFQWKYLAFAREMKIFLHVIKDQGHTSADVVSVGDAGHERLALLRSSNTIDGIRPKSVKLVERPAVPLLAKQHELLRNCLRHIVKHDGPLDLCLKFS